MRDSTEQIGWVVTILLAIAAIIANTLMMPPTDEPIGEPGGGPFVVTIFMILIAICGFLAMRYKWRD